MYDSCIPEIWAVTWIVCWPHDKLLHMTRFTSDYEQDFVKHSIWSNGAYNRPTKMCPHPRHQQNPLLWEYMNCGLVKAEHSRGGPGVERSTYRPFNLLCTPDSRFQHQHHTFCGFGSNKPRPVQSFDLSTPWVYGNRRLQPLRVRGYP